MNPNRQRQRLDLPLACTLSTTGQGVLGGDGAGVLGEGGFFPVCLISVEEVVVVVPPGVLTLSSVLTSDFSPQPTMPSDIVKRPVPARAVMSFFMIYLLSCGFSAARALTRGAFRSLSPNLLCKIHASRCIDNERTR